MILDPSVNLAGVLMKQNALAAAQGKQMHYSVMVSVFENQQQGQQQPQQMPTMAQQQGYQPQQGFQQQGKQ